MILDIQIQDKHVLLTILSQLSFHFHVIALPCRAGAKCHSEQVAAINDCRSDPVKVNGCKAWIWIKNTETAWYHLWLCSMLLRLIMFRHLLLSLLSKHFLLFCFCWAFGQHWNPVKSECFTLRIQETSWYGPDLTSLQLDEIGTTTPHMTWVLQKQKSTCSVSYNLLKGASSLFTGFAL